MPSGIPSRFPVRNPAWIKERVQNEGIPFWSTWGSNTFWYGKTGAGGASIGGIYIATAYRAAYIDSITVTASIPAVIQILGPYLTYGGSALPAGGVQSASYHIGPGGLTIPIDSFFGPDNSGLGAALLSVPSQNPSMYRAFVANSGGTTLSVAKTFNSNNSADTTNYSYTLSVSNASGSTASGTTTITDTVPPDAAVVATSGTGWTVSVSGGVLTATSTTSVNSGASLPTLTVTLQATRSVQINLSAHGWQTDFDVFADLPPIVWCGTSISAATGTSYSTSYPYLIRNWFRDTKGINTRVSNRAISGSHSTHHEYLRAFNGRYTFNEAPFVVFWEHGVNDVAQGVSTATTQSNLTKWLNYWNTFYPQTWCVVLNPFPTGNSSYETGLATLRTAIASTMQTVGGSKNIFISQTGSMFNPTTQSGTYTSDNIHLNDAGCALAASTIQTALNSYF
jgi:hypothetical protein